MSDSDLTRELDNGPPDDCVQGYRQYDWLMSCIRRLSRKVDVHAVALSDSVDIETLAAETFGAEQPAAAAPHRTCAICGHADNRHWTNESEEEGCLDCKCDGFRESTAPAPAPGKRTLIEKLFMAIEERWAPGSYAVTLLKREYVAMSTAPAPAGENAGLVDELAEALRARFYLCECEEVGGICPSCERDTHLLGEYDIAKAARSQPAAVAEGVYDRATCEAVVNVPYMTGSAAREILRLAGTPLTTGGPTT